MRKLNIGCGPKSRWIEGTEGIDIIDFGQKYCGDILNYDFKDDSSYKPFDMIYAHHIVEHVEDQIALFNKLGEILIKDGIIDIRVPTIPFQQAFVDPTHVKYIPQDAEAYFRYFTKDSAAGHCYSSTVFKILHSDRDRFEWEAHVTMKKL